jgi:hypothetical protein
MIIKWSPPVGKARESESDYSEAKEGEINLQKDTEYKRYWKEATLEKRSCQIL